MGAGGRDRRYLQQALGLKKRLVCVLNKGADEDVARDFCEVVVPGLGGPGREGAPEIVTLPWIVPKPDPAATIARAASWLATQVARTPAVNMASQRKRGCSQNGLAQVNSPSSFICS